MDPLSFFAVFALSRQPKPAPIVEPPGVNRPIPEIFPKPPQVADAVPPIPHIELHAPPPIPQPKPVVKKEGPMLWRLVDRFGMGWIHQDPEYLKHFVAQRNSLTRPSVLYSTSGACAGGLCYR